VFVRATKRKILIVDDDQDGAASLGLLLQICGHEVTVRYDADSCLELLETFRPEVVFLDLSMPVLTGYDLCRHIRATSWGDEPFVFAFTGWMHVEPEALAAGFDGCLLKPRSLEQLQLLLANPAAQSSRVLSQRRSPMAVTADKTGNAEEA
jgi:CheY-like chemotaxis protein